MHLPEPDKQENKRHAPSECFNSGWTVLRRCPDVPGKPRENRNEILDPSMAGVPETPPTNDPAVLRNSSRNL